MDLSAFELLTPHHETTINEDLYDHEPGSSVLHAPFRERNEEGGGSEVKATYDEVKLCSFLLWVDTIVTPRAAGSGFL